MNRRTFAHATRSAPVALAALLAAAAASMADGPQAVDETSMTPAHTNQLIHATSPHLLQHAHDPVNWQPWGPAAFQQAALEDKPIFLSIGYASCHWCHVMRRDSFQAEDIAKLLNDNFVCIKVDREERPNIDEVFMQATLAATEGRGGWPMTLFMTPDRKPFFADTYLAPEPRSGRPGFRSTCRNIAQRWKENRQLVINDADALIGKALRYKSNEPTAEVISRETMTRRVERLPDRFDEQYGGVKSKSSKFPPSVTLELMLRQFILQADESMPQLVDAVEITLEHMAAGGIYDHIGGGMFHYSTDPEWFVPSFEKMLYDQAVIAGVYLSAYQLTENEAYARTARGLLDYCLADLRDDKGGFYASRDSQSEGEQGKFYVWTKSEIDAVLSAEDAALFAEYYNVTPEGNWTDGRNILHVTTDQAAFARRHEMAPAQWRERLERMGRKMNEARNKRTPPTLDDSILAEWNGLMITTLARAHRILNEPRYGLAAAQAANFIRNEMIKDGRLFRVHRAGKSHVHGTAADYANVVEALITLYETTFEPGWLAAAVQLNDAFIKTFHDSANGGFYFSAADGERLFFRTKLPRDASLPSPNSTGAHNLLRLAIHLNKPELREYAAGSMKALGREISRGYMRRMLWTAMFYHTQPKEIAIIGDPADPATQALVAEAYRNYVPNKIVALARPADAAHPDAPPLIKGKKMLDGKPTAFVCLNYKCEKPVTTPADLAEQLTAQ
ncbi:MAG: thioredoxin domain-containing protein [Planctomycetes bacterium]|nr:thioredoxin domain-containing protein [Planctomycetota bacterium]